VDIKGGVHSQNYLPNLAKRCPKGPHNLMHLWFNEMIFEG